MNLHCQQSCTSGPCVDSYNHRRKTAWPLRTPPNRSAPPPKEADASHVRPLPPCTLATVPRPPRANPCPYPPPNVLATSERHPTSVPRHQNHLATSTANTISTNTAPRLDPIAAAVVVVCTRQPTRRACVSFIPDTHCSQLGRLRCCGRCMLPKATHTRHHGTPLSPSLLLCHVPCVFFLTANSTPYYCAVVLLHDPLSVPPLPLPQSVLPLQRVGIRSPQGTKRITIEADATVEDLFRQVCAGASGFAVHVSGGKGHTCSASLSHQHPYTTHGSHNMIPSASQSLRLCTPGAVQGCQSARHHRKLLSSA